MRMEHGRSHICRLCLAAALIPLSASLPALAQGAPTAALAELDAHARAFPRGALGPEAQMLRVDALLASGDTAGGRALAAQLLARDPAGPHAKRLRTLIAQDSAARQD